MASSLVSYTITYRNQEKNQLHQKKKGAGEGFVKAVVLSSAASLKAKACLPCCLDVEYMTRKSPGDEKLNPVYNCCLASKHCSTLHLPDGSSVYCN
ncbi:uncharacterized protein LOC110419579 [Herrania umbratica]|uniref:Uncharacterized protein LOC110419579 n=1 Tax=Herrania umbratica TaxID=108875 RepID=A0A6J1AN22_9ROSI|nr:uncharacterized protein LOC110419579 [Herrania umbratica]